MYVNETDKSWFQCASVGAKSNTDVLCFLCFSVPCWENSFWPNSSMQRFPATRLSSSADWRWRQNCVYIICRWIIKFAQFDLCPLLKLRTRSSLLESLQTELSTQSRCMMGDPALSALPFSEGVRGASEGSGGFIENFKVRVGILLNILWLDYFYSVNCLSVSLQRAIRVRSHSFETLGVPRKISGSTSQRPKVKIPNGSEQVSLNIYLLKGVIIFFITSLTGRERWRQVRFSKAGENIFIFYDLIVQRWLFSLIFSEKSLGPLPTLPDSLGLAEIKDQASPQEETWESERNILIWDVNLDALLVHMVTSVLSGGWLVCK